MKKVHMSNMDTLYQMQDKVTNVYSSLVINNIESVACDGVGTFRGILHGYILDGIVDMKEY